MAETPKNPEIEETKEVNTAPVSEIPEETVVAEPIVPEPVEEPVTETVQETTEEPIAPEPVEPIEPVVVEPTVETTVKPVIETPTPVVAEEPKKTADTKVETVQDIKAKETTNEAQENELNETKKNQVVSEMQKMIQNGSTLEEIAAYGTKNIQFKDDINTVLRGSFKNLANTKYFGKYSTLNSDDMYAAYIAGDVVPSSEQYNILPAEQKARFESYLKEKDAEKLSERKVFTVSDNITSLSKLEEAKSKMFDSKVRENYTKALNKPELKNANDRLSSVQEQIMDLDDTIDETQDKLEKIYAGQLPGSVRSKVNEQLKQLYNQKKILLRDERQVLGQISTLKSDAEMELKISMYEDGIAREQYQTEFSLYKDKVKRGEKLEDRDFALKTQIQAEERQKAFQVEMKELDQKLKAENKSGTYQTDRDGNLLYVVNGTATKVKDSEGTVVGVTQKKGEYSESIQRNTDGTYSVFRTYEDGRKPEMFNYGIDGNSSYNTQMGVYDALSNIDSKPGKYFNGAVGKLQCGEAVNRYLKTVGISDMRVGNSYESKKAIINNNVPQVGGLAVWNPNSQGEFGEYGHIGIVTGYNPDKGEIEITDWNKEGNGEKNTYNIPVSQVLNSDGGFTHLEGEEETFVAGTGGFSEADTPLYKEFLNKGTLTKGTLDTIEDFEVFKQEALNYQKELNAQGTPQIKKLIELATDLRDNSPSRANRIASGTSIGQLASPELSDYQANFDAFISNNALDQLVSLKQNGATFGALSDRELNFIQSSATNLRSNLSDDAYKKELNRIIDGLKTGLSEETAEQVQTSNINSLSDEFNSYNNSAAGVANTQADYSSTLGF